MNQALPKSSSIHEIFYHAILTDKLAQAHIFTCPSEILLQNTILSLAKMMLCNEKERSNCQCVSCRYDDIKVHPDVTILGALNESSTVKAQDIRRLTDIFYLKPQITNKRVVIIHSIATLNAYAANALLKIIEEPPSYLVFLFSCQQTATILPTILSRCQLWRLEDSTKHKMGLPDNGYLNDTNPKLLVLNDKELLLETICAIKNKKLSPYEAVDQWKKYDSSALLWFLYWITSLSIKTHYDSGCELSTAESRWIEEISKLDCELLFKQIAVITASIKQKAQGISINDTLLLEDLLKTYQG